MLQLKFNLKLVKLDFPYVLLGGKKKIRGGWGEETFGPPCIRQSHMFNLLDISLNNANNRNDAGQRVDFHRMKGE